MRRPVFWFLWPAAEPGPLDGEAVQARWTRVCGRGPWRWAFLAIFTVLVATVVSAAVAATLAQPTWASVGLSILVAIPLIGLLARAWVAGTYVSDRGIKVSRILTTDSVPWPAVHDVATVAATRWLGLPGKVPGSRIVVSYDDAEGAPSVISTHIESASPDLWLRPQAFAASRDRLNTWLRETRGSHEGH